MAQGDITVLNYAAKLVLDGSFWSISSAQIAPMNPGIKAKYDDDANDIARYVTIGTPQYISISPSGYNRFYTSRAVLFDRDPSLSRVYQFLLYKSSPGGSPIAFIDATEDGGVTPWDLSMTPLRLEFGAGLTIFRTAVA